MEWLIRFLTIRRVGIVDSVRVDSMVAGERANRLVSVDGKARWCLDRRFWNFELRLEVARVVQSSGGSSID